MSTITWNHPCNYCHRPIIRGLPTVLFATDKPLLLGISHSTCCFTQHNLGRYQMHPPNHLSREYVTFLIQFFPMMYSLPGGLEPNAALRFCLSDFHWNYPTIIANPMKCVYDFQELHKYKAQTYEGDLEADYISFLAKVQKAAKENPVNVEFDFP